MSHSSDNSLAPPASGSNSLWDWCVIYFQLSKARLCFLVMVTTAAGYFLAIDRTSWTEIPWGHFFSTIVGTFLAACSASIFNQMMEVDRDRLMKRTCERPLPAGRISLAHAGALGVLLGGFSLTLLGSMVSAGAMGLAALSLLLYIAAYTPLKTRTSLNTWVGAIVGAIPPILGWVAVRGDISAPAWCLGGILFVWQIPHFLALAWLYRDDYAAAGYKMLPSIDPKGILTGQATMMWALGLLPVGMSLTWIGSLTWFYGVGSAILGGWFIASCLKLQETLTLEQARRVFYVSLFYMSLILVLIVVDLRIQKMMISSDNQGTAPHIDSPSPPVIPKVSTPRIAPETPPPALSQPATMIMTSPQWRLSNRHDIVSDIDYLVGGAALISYTGDSDDRPVMRT